MKSIKRFRGKKLILTAVAFISLVAGAGVLHAGWKITATDWEVKFSGSGTYRVFEGYMGAARASADSYQWIGCEVEWYGPTQYTTTSSQPNNSGWCYASDKYGNVKSCVVTIKGNAAASVLGNIFQNSYIWAQYFTLEGTPYCSDVRIMNYSYDPVMK